MIEKKVYEELEKEFKDAASWAVWSPPSSDPKAGVKAGSGDMSVFHDPDLLEKLHSNFVLIAINASEHQPRKDGYTGSWRMFHSDDYRRQQDFKMRHAFIDTPIWGSYMTDIIKNYPEKNSNEVVKHVKENPQVLEENIAVLREELKILGGKPILIALGDVVEEWLLGNLKDEYKIVKLPHYSIYIGKEKYREIALKLIEENL